jgi:serine phosphatase RsbU (regulator of sigma subunit)/CHASE3 domain sensor protein
MHAKLLAGFLVLALLLLGMGILSLVIISRMNNRVRELSDLQETVDRSLEMKFLITAQSHFRAMALTCEFAQLPTPPIDSANDCTADPPWNERIADAKQQFAGHLDYIDRISQPEQDEFFAAVRQTNARYAASGERALNLDEAGDVEGALGIHIDEEHEISHELEASMDTLIKESSEQMAQARAAFSSDRNLLTTVVVVASGASLIVALSLGLILPWAFMRPVRRINYALARIAGGDFSQRVEVPNRDELGMLSTNLNRTSGQLASLYEELQSLNEDLKKRVDEQVDELAREAKQRERTEHEMQIAHGIQMAFLPKQPPDLPGWQIATHYQPARAVGGDFYDFIELSDRYRAIVIGDVSDKGVPAALVMCATRSMLRAASHQMTSPGKVLEQVNEVLYADIPPNMFVTCLYAILDTMNGTLHYANAGHNLPYLRTAGGVSELRATGMPLGLMSGMTYEERTVDLAPGDSILFHSDGLVEAHSAEREMFGSPRLLDLVKKHPGGGPLIDGLLGELTGFTGVGWEQEDDVTLVTLERRHTRVLGRPALRRMGASRGLEC